MQNLKDIKLYLSENKNHFFKFGFLTISMIVLIDACYNHSGS